MQTPADHHVGRDFQVVPDVELMSAGEDERVVGHQPFDGHRAHFATFVGLELKVPSHGFGPW